MSVEDELTRAFRRHADDAAPRDGRWEGVERAIRRAHAMRLVSITSVTAATTIVAVATSFALSRPSGTGLVNPGDNAPAVSTSPTEQASPSSEPTPTQTTSATEMPTPSAAPTPSPTTSPTPVETSDPTPSPTQASPGGLEPEEGTVEPGIPDDAFRRTLLLWLDARVRGSGAEAYWCCEASQRYSPGDMTVYGAAYDITAYRVERRYDVTAQRTTYDIVLLHEMRDRPDEPAAADTREEIVVGYEAGTSPPNDRTKVMVWTDKGYA